MWNIQRMPSACEATTQADDASATADDFSRLIEKTAELKSLIQALRPEYQHSRPYLFGGTGASAGKLFTAYAPYDSACEYTILAVTFADAGLCALSSNGDPTGVANGKPDITQEAQYGVQVYASAAEATITPSPNWFALEANGVLSLSVVSASKVCYVSVQFRRRINPAGVPNPGF